MEQESKGIELKTVNPVVFKDPEFCNIQDCVDNDQCIFLDESTTYCSLFQMPNEFNSNNEQVEKCQECKDHYQKAIEAEEKNSSDIA